MRCPPTRAIGGMCDGRVRFQMSRTTKANRQWLRNGVAVLHHAREMRGREDGHGGRIRLKQFVPGNRGK
jgi:hypothetical protein